MARMNRALRPALETVFLAAAPERSFVSASLVREIARLGGDVGQFLSPAVLRRVLERVAGGGRGA
jgi:pantetheine-phosphate adenylyltransferase